MASFTSSGWGAGATVNAFARDAFGKATGAAVGGSPKTASSAGQVTFDPLADNTGYVATDGTRTVSFRTPVASATGTPADLSITARMLADLARTGGWLPQDSAARPGIAETVPHRIASTTTISITDGAMRVIGGIVIPGGRAISSLTFVSGSQALATGTHQWACLVDKATLQVLAVSADATSAAWAASTAKTFDLTSAYTPASAVEAYVGLVVTATTVPQLTGVGMATALASLTPVFVGNSTTGLTTPLTVGTTVTAPTATASGVPYAFVA